MHADLAECAGNDLPQLVAPAVVCGQMLSRRSSSNRLELAVLVGECVRWGKGRSAVSAGHKVMSVVFAMLLGAPSIGGCDVLRNGRTGGG